MRLLAFTVAWFVGAGCIGQTTPADPEFDLDGTVEPKIPHVGERFWLNVTLTRDATEGLPSHANYSANPIQPPAGFRVLEESPWRGSLPQGGHSNHSYAFEAQRAGAWEIELNITVYGRLDDPSVAGQWHGAGFPVTIQELKGQ